MVNEENKKPLDENGLEHGYWEIYYYDGDLSSKGNFIHGKKHGYWEYYIGGDVLDFCGCFINGKRYGIWIEHYPDIFLYDFEYYHMDIRLFKTSKNKFIL